MVPNFIGVEGNARVFLATGVFAATAGALYCYWKVKKNTPPQNWIPVGKVKSLYLYPLKSGRRMEISDAECNEHGLQLKTTYPQLKDRCLVVYKEETKEFLTARTYPTLLFIQTSAHQDHFKLTAPDMEPLELEIPLVNENYKNVISMWFGERVSTLDCGDKAAAWISSYILGRPSGLRVGYQDEHFRRGAVLKQLSKTFPKLDNSTMGIFSDLATILLLNESSVDDLIERIPNTDVTEHNFRSNIVIQGDGIEPYAEDNWDWIKIGDAILRNVLCCGRCSITTVNPVTAKFSKNYEPIKTLKTYRPLMKADNVAYPNFGIYLSLYQQGIISVGETVYIGKN